MTESQAILKKELNSRQLEAVAHGDAPLLVIAGAGTGKTRTLVHRVAHLIHQGQDPSRILLLTFTRRAAQEMLRRVNGLLSRTGDVATRVWGGTFHAISVRLLRTYGKLIGLEDSFTILDRSDAEDFLEVIRTELGFDAMRARFPQKRTCLSIYSYCVNAGKSLDEVLQGQYAWCADAQPYLKELFQQYVQRKEQSQVLDYDDLLLYWNGILGLEAAADAIRNRFDCVLVDEYQDTNQLQAAILKQMKPDGRGLTVVGDDAQSIYSFRAANVENILEFETQFQGARVVKLEQNYRSSSGILAASNRLIRQAGQAYHKELWTERASERVPILLDCKDEVDQATKIADRILELHEEGLLLRQQAVLFRAANHSTLLEAELAKRKVPFVKYGGLKFLEAAHVKDLIAFLRLAENHRDAMAGIRILKLLPGIGPRKAAQLSAALTELKGDFSAWGEARVPPATRDQFRALAGLLHTIAGEGDLAAQVEQTRRFYLPFLEDQYENSEPRKRDLVQLQILMGRFPDRQTMLAELALDPPASTQDLTEETQRDEDYLVLSTIHSAKGLEWKAVYLINASDGNLPSDMAVGSQAQLDEELRLMYVAVTRAEDWLCVSAPQRYYQTPRGPRADRYGLAQLSRFLSDDVLDCFNREMTPEQSEQEQQIARGAEDLRATIRQQLDRFWD